MHHLNRRERHSVTFLQSTTPSSNLHLQQLWKEEKVLEIISSILNLLSNKQQLHLNLQDHPLEPLDLPRGALHLPMELEDLVQDLLLESENWKRHIPVLSFQLEEPYSLDCRLDQERRELWGRDPIHTEVDPKVLVLALVILSLDLGMGMGMGMELLILSRDLQLQLQEELNPLPTTLPPSVL